MVAVLADTAYVKHTRLTPRKKTTGLPKAWNRHIASLRAPVERAISLLKQWKILSAGYRGRLAELPSIIHIITNLEFYRLTR